MTEDRELRSEDPIPDVTLPGTMGIEEPGL